MYTGTWAKSWSINWPIHISNKVLIALGFSSADVQVEDISLDDSSCSLFLANLGIITSSPYAFGSNLWTGVSDLPYYVTVHIDFF